jgi:hypothetical protein
MNQRILQIVFQILLTITLFSVWVGFALLVVNRFFYTNLQGYKIGRICIWEFIALVLAVSIARIMIRKWGNIQYQVIDNHMKLTMDPKYGIYFAIYFLIALCIGLWQFWVFSQRF